MNLSNTTFQHLNNAPHCSHYENIRYIQRAKIGEFSTFEHWVFNILRNFCATQHAPFGSIRAQKSHTSLAENVAEMLRYVP